MEPMYRPILFALILALVFGFGSPAYAYLDAGTGTMLLQVLVGGVAGALVIGKLYWHRLKQFLGIGQSKDSASKADAE